MAEILELTPILDPVDDDEDLERVSFIRRCPECGRLLNIGSGCEIGLADLTLQGWRCSEHGFITPSGFNY